MIVLHKMTANEDCDYMLLLQIYLSYVLFSHYRLWSSLIIIYSHKEAFKKGCIFAFYPSSIVLNNWIHIYILYVRSARFMQLLNIKTSIILQIQRIKDTEKMPVLHVLWRNMNNFEIDSFCWFCVCFIAWIKWNISLICSS